MTLKEFRQLKVGDKIRSIGTKNEYTVSEPCTHGVVKIGIFGQATIPKLWEKVPEAEIEQWDVYVRQDNYDCPFHYMDDCAHVDNKLQKCLFKECPIKKK